MTKNLGMRVLAVYLIVVGLVALLGLTFANIGIVIGALAIAAGVLLLMGR
jgi:hypothetical protein